VVYQVYPRSFQDSDGDGTGDLPGVIERLDYLVTLGVNAVWLSPFFPSPMADFGYDVSDYTDVDPLFGTLADAERLIHEAHGRGLKIIIDFVPNHSSDQHPWFIESRSSRDNPKRDWYIWHDGSPSGGVPNNWDSVFGGSAWEWDDATGQYYLHSFLKEQPDLNWRNPDVQQAMTDAMRFWLDRGVDGFRVDVIWKMIKDDQFRDNPPNPDYEPNVLFSMEELQVYNENRPEVHDLVRMMRETVDEYDRRVLIGEIYLDVPELVAYYGDTLDGAHLPFNFSLILNPWDAETVADLITRYEAELPDGAWPNWVLGNHDQSRLATRIGRDQARVAAMLLLTLRGTPTIYYGEEIGMENVPIPEDQQIDPAGLVITGMNRDPERTPMRWNDGEGARFTTGEPWLPIGGNVDAVNVTTQRDDRDSLLSFYRWLLQFRRSEQAISLGDYERVWHDSGVLAYTRTDGNRRFLIALNFGGDATALPSDATASGTIVVGTTISRVGSRVEGDVNLAGHEGVIVALPPIDR
jgi:alpha-glucosidase